MTDMSDGWSILPGARPSVRQTADRDQDTLTMGERFWNDKAHHLPVRGIVYGNERMVEFKYT